MRIYAELERQNGEVKLRVQHEGAWYVVRFPETLFDQLNHTKGEIIKLVTMIQ